MSKSTTKLSNRVWAYKHFTHQLRFELSVVNWYRISGQLMDAFEAFVSVLTLVKSDPSDKKIKLNEEKTREYLKLWFGTDHSSIDPMKRGLYAFQVVQREFDPEHVVYCRGFSRKKVDDPRNPGRKVWVTDTLTPEVHHTATMKLYQKMLPTMMELWHTIRRFVEGYDDDLDPETKKRLKELRARARAEDEAEKKELDALEERFQEESGFPKLPEALVTEAHDND
jgi:hypothetical protein